MTGVQIYTAEQAAALLGCSVNTVEEMARQGQLPGIKPGGGWVFPAGALALRLDELAIDEAERRRRPRPATATTSLARAGKTKRGPRVLPRLVDVGIGG